MSQTSNNNKRNRRAVSPIVAVLILIVVAVVGGGAVALLMGNITSQTSNQASSAASANKSASTLNIGGSTTVFPITEAVKGNFTAHTGITVTDAQGGSGAGMVGVDQGVLDIGAASSQKAVDDQIAKTPNDNLVDHLIGGSGIIMVVKGTAAGGQIAGTGGTCTDIPAGIAEQLFITTGGPYYTFTCNGAGIVTGVVSTASTTAGAVQVFVRSDLPSGTADQFMTWAAQNTAANSGTINGTATGAAGNSLVFQGVLNAAGQAIGFVDVGFDKTAAGNANLAIIGMQSTSGAITNSGVTGAWTGATTNVAVTATGFQPAVNAGASVSALEKNIKNSLKQAGQFPGDNTNAQTQASRTFHYVTKGQPSATEAAFINFVKGTDPVVTDAFHNLGYYSIYDFK